MKLQGIILDFDGTILESAHIKDQGWQDLFKDYGPSIVGTVMEYHLAHEHQNRYEKFRYVTEQVLGEEYTPEMEAKLDSAYTALVFDAIVVCPFVVGTQEFLDFFSNRVALIIVTVNPREYFEIIIVARGIRQYFSDIYTSPWTKPEAFQDILKKYHQQSGSWVSIGDTEDDYRAARGVGIEFIGRDSGRFATNGTFARFGDMVGIKKYLCSRYTFV
ncbi:HAD hydrolase-like protein [Candidatus Uhrbacteria bacterium]|nr:HAD hydrolase-like protein [Candidatus Uhrbacteria bacterium]